jgi:hypothetical protein
MHVVSGMIHDVGIGLERGQDLLDTVIAVAVMVERVERPSLLPPVSTWNLGRRLVQENNV